MTTLLKWMIWGYPYFRKHPYNYCYLAINHTIYFILGYITQLKLCFIDEVAGTVLTVPVCLGKKYDHLLHGAIASSRSKSYLKVKIDGTDTRS